MMKILIIYLFHFYFFHLQFCISIVIGFGSKGEIERVDLVKIRQEIVKTRLSFLFFIFIFNSISILFKYEKLGRGEELQKRVFVTSKTNKTKKKK
jgi:hypothetical protein